MGIYLFRWNRLSTPYRIYTAALFSHASPAKQVAGESEEQQSERTGDFSKKITASDAQLATNWRSGWDSFSCGKRHGGCGAPLAPR